MVENLVSSWIFAAAQQVLSDSATASLPASVFQDGLDNNSPAKFLPHSGKQQEQKERMAEAKTSLYPTRTSSLQSRRSGSIEPPWANISASSQTIFDSTISDAGPRSAREKSAKERNDSIYNHNLEQLAAQRSELYLLQRRILEHTGRSYGWKAGWPAILEQGSNKTASLSEVSLDADSEVQSAHEDPKQTAPQNSGREGLAVQALATSVGSLETFRVLYIVSYFQRVAHIDGMSNSDSL